ncbi:class I SAM-dependent methyltransferase [Chitinispirillales bacterium ANBcel5]|uniref:class I SAM-dependent DNA methyltransferase n=1 Tax=Cellulosispirillum alkaliphilum TaxID=3039283 RepID=UPI002A56F5FB|nr:class I SAM-dependent methyltransferase [Chitinispirillales bacterium ANBcel5]
MDKKKQILCSSEKRGKMVERLKEYERLCKYYDQDWADGVETFKPLIENTLSRHCPSCSNILDLGCGTGVLANYLAEQGHKVDGVDLSAAMIEVARSRKVPGANFYVKNMRRFEPQKQYDLITCTFDAINYLKGTEELEELFLMISKALVPGGFFLFDSNTEPLYVNRHFGKMVRNVDGYRFIQHRVYDKMTKTAYTRFDYPDGAWEIHTQYPYSLTDFLEPVRKAGLFIYRSFGGFNGENYDSDSEHLVCMVRSPSML